MAERRRALKALKRCPRCPDGKLVERTNTANGSRFLGCTNWPVRRDDAGEFVGCNHTEPLPAYFRMLAAGAAQLPGFDT